MNDLSSLMPLPRDVEGRVARRELWRAEATRLRVLVLRYPWEASVALLSYAFIFVVLAVAGSLAQGSGAPFTGNVQSLAVLYVLWTLCISCISAGAAQVGADAATGVLENLFLSTAPVVTILQVRAGVQALYGLCSSLVLLGAFCGGTRWWPSPVVVATFAAVALGCVLTGIGLAMMFAGIALLSKRASMLAMPVNFLCILAMTTQHAPAFERLGNVLLYLPFVAGSIAVRHAVEQGRFDPVLCGVALAVTLPYLLLGRLVLAACAMACRRAGTTSVY